MAKQATLALILLLFSVSVVSAGLWDRCRDLDGPGLTDRQDSHRSPSGADSDGDGVPDASDNCPHIPNPDQLDTDGFVESVVIEEPEGTSWYRWSVFAADLDGDGDEDYLSASTADAGPIAWYENTDGAGSFGPPQPVYSEETDIVRAADLDGDLDIDVLAGFPLSGDNYAVAWFMNLDGLGNFGGTRVINAAALPVFSLAATDLDGDSDPDILVGGYRSPFRRIDWYENQGDGNFGSGTTIGTDVHLAVAADLDDDDDIDVVGAGPSGIWWYENRNGLGFFDPPQLISTENGLAVDATDLDGDGDVDVVAALRIYENEPPWNELDYLVWYENLDGLGSFGPSTALDSLALNNPASYVVRSADLDMDDRMDLVVGQNQTDFGLLWYQNQGDAIDFRTVTIVPRGADSIFVADLDLDGAPDVLSGHHKSAYPYQFTIAWYESIGDGSGDVCDCAPSDPLVLRPRDVPGLELLRIDLTTARLVWDQTPGADRYSITRGMLSEIEVGQFGQCLVEDLVVELYDDADVPSAGTGYGYLAKGISDVCGPGTLGYPSGGVERVNLDPLACP